MGSMVKAPRWTLARLMFALYALVRLRARFTPLGDGWRYESARVRCFGLSRLDVARRASDVEVRRWRESSARSPLAVTVILAALCAMSACASPVVLVLGATVDGHAELSAQVEGFDVPLEFIADGSGSAALRWGVGTLDAELTADAGVCAMAKLGPWVLAAETCVETGD